MRPFDDSLLIADAFKEIFFRWNVFSLFFFLLLPSLPWYLKRRIKWRDGGSFDNNKDNFEFIFTVRFIINFESGSYIVCIYLVSFVFSSFSSTMDKFI